MTLVIKHFFIFLFVVSLLLCSYASDAQNFKAGITGGFISSDVCYDDPIDHDNDFHKAGYVFGGYVQRDVSENGILQLEINLIQKGTLQNPDSTGFGYYRLLLNYVEVPVLYKYHLTFTSAKKPVSTFDIHAGASIGWLYHSSLEGDVYSSSDMSFLNKTDVSLLIGVNYNFLENFSFCVRYSNSIIPVFKSEALPARYYLPPNSAFNSGNNMVFHFMLQYTI